MSSSNPSHAFSQSVQQPYEVERIILFLQLRTKGSEKFSNLAEATCLKAVKTSIHGFLFCLAFVVVRDLKCQIFSSKAVLTSFTCH